MFATTATAGSSGLPCGVSRLLGGVAFSPGLILVVVAGAVLFTGNNLIVMAWASGRVSTLRPLRNWAIVYAGNFVGAIATAGLVYAAKQYEFGKGAIGAQALTIAAAKTGLGFGQAGALCNALVCPSPCGSATARGRRRTRSSRSSRRSLPSSPPASNTERREHVVPAVRPLREERHGIRVLDAARPGPLAPDLGVVDRGNLVSVTIGNVIGVALMVGAVYWLIYLRHGLAPSPPPVQRRQNARSTARHGVLHHELSRPLQRLDGRDGEHGNDRRRAGGARVDLATARGADEVEVRRRRPRASPARSRRRHRTRSGRVRARRP
jgi:formate transporter